MTATDSKWLWQTQNGCDKLKWLWRTQVLRSHLVNLYLLEKYKWKWNVLYLDLKTAFYSVGIWWRAAKRFLNFCHGHEDSVWNATIFNDFANETCKCTFVLSEANIVHINEGVKKNSELLSGSPCSSSPCTNNSTCVDMKSETFLCLCRAGFFGETCGKSKY